MAAGLTHSICSPKLDSVEKYITEVCLLTHGAGLEALQTKQKTPTPTDHTDSLFLDPVLDREGVFGRGLRSGLPAPPQ